MNVFKWFCVNYWNHDPRINDCVGNSVTRRVKARTIFEAIEKVKKQNELIWFRLRQVTISDSPFQEPFATIRRYELEVLSKYKQYL